MSRLRLSRHPGEKIYLIKGDERLDVFIGRVRRVKGKMTVTLVIDAPLDVKILRGELLDNPQRRFIRNA